VHTCPGGDRDSTHSADVDYAELLPSLFELKVGNFYIALAGEKDRVHVLKIIRQYMKPDQRIFVGVVAPIDLHVETPEEVRDRVLEAAEYIPVEQLGTTDDCGFSPFSDDTSTSRDTAFAKIRARVLGTALAAKTIGRPAYSEARAHPRTSKAPCPRLQAHRPLGHHSTRGRRSAGRARSDPAGAYRMRRGSVDCQHCR
jgi:5-methyltetrahydropteroyltriglutamate--homocysteine methyltransferase